MSTPEVVPSILDNQPWHGSASFPLNDPHTGEELYTVSSVTTDDCLKAVESAATAFKEWKKTGSATRRAIFLKAAQLLQERKDEYVKLTVEETTGNAFWGATDHQLAWNIIDETAALATALKGETIPLDHGSRAYVERIPYGVILGIAPWNAPFNLGVRAFANAIMAGNTVVFKTSEFSPKVHTFATQLFVDAGLPPGVLNMIHVAPADAPAVCEKIIAHPAVRKINFTGSTFVGTKLAEVCARHVKPACMELGGKAPVIVMKDADLQAAANAVMFGGFTHQGQICMASDSLLVHEDIADEFVKILEGLLKTKKASSAKPESLSAMRGVFNNMHADKLTGLIGDAIQKGAKIAAGSASTERNVVQPIILEGIEPSMAIDSQEIFGPAMTLKRFKTTDEAIEWANSSEFGLAASIYGSNHEECWAIAEELESGQVHINGPTVHDVQRVPHGGLKKSGYGRFNGIEGIREFSTPKTISTHIPHGQYPI